MLYEMSDKSLTGIDRTSFHEQGVLEADLQEALREHPEIIEQGLLVIADEFTDWEDAWRYIDLLCIDSSGRLVVVELKRGDGVHMELQAIRYAAMLANSTTQRIVAGHAGYLRGKGINGTAEEQIRDHLGLTADEELSIATERPRIILVSEDFNREITTSVLWLNEMGLDIRCVRARAYRHQGKLLLDIDQVIPLPEAEDYLVTARSREQETRAAEVNQAPERVPDASEFMESISELPEESRSRFDQLLAFVKRLQSSGLARFVSYRYKRGGAGLQVLMPKHGTHLSIVGSDNGRPFVYLYRPYFDRYAPGHSETLWEKFDVEPRDKSDAWLYDTFSEDALDALFDAYRAANEG